MTIAAVYTGLISLESVFYHFIDPSLSQDKTLRKIQSAMTTHIGKIQSFFALVHLNAYFQTTFDLANKISSLALPRFRPVARGLSTITLYALACAATLAATSILFKRKEREENGSVSLCDGNNLSLQIMHVFQAAVSSLYSFLHPSSLLRVLATWTTLHKLREFRWLLCEGSRRWGILTFTIQQHLFLRPMATEEPCSICDASDEKIAFCSENHVVCVPCSKQYAVHKMKENLVSLRDFHAILPNLSCPLCRELPNWNGLNVQVRR